jgi:hypothetical protein
LIEVFVGGFVYLMSNPAMPKLLKIGKSDRDPTEFRVSELYTTGVPEPFKVEYVAYVDDHHRLEQVLHSRFNQLRPNPSREFFRISVEEVILAVRQSGSIDFERTYFKSETEIQKEKARQDEAQARARFIAAQVAAEEERRAEASRLALQAERDNQERWERSVAFARKTVEDKRQFYFNNFAYTRTWRFFYCFAAVYGILGIALSSLAIFVSAVLTFLPLSWWVARSRKQEQAASVYSEEVIRQVANIHHAGGDYERFLQGVLRDAISRKSSS